MIPVTKRYNLESIVTILTKFLYIHVNFEYTIKQWYNYFIYHFIIMIQRTNRYCFIKEASFINVILE